MSRTGKVLCVLLDDHRREYEAEFAKLHRTGADLVFESSPEKSLEMISDLDPRLIIVGIDVGTMEGIEFLALLTKRYPGFGGSVVVLPGKSDGLPPVIHSRARSTGRSAVESADFDRIAQLVDPAASAREAARAPEPEEFLEPVPVEEKHTPARTRWLVPLAAAAGVLSLCVVGYFAFSGGGEAKQNSSITAIPQDTGAAPVNPADEPRPAAVASAVDDSGEKKAAVEPPAPPEDEPEQEQPSESEQPPPPDEYILPLTFADGIGRPSVADENAFDEIVEALRSQSGATIELTGHTSAPGETEDNYKLGMLRARMTKKLLVRRGIPPGRFKLKSKGESIPIDTRQTGEGQARNRRVTARIIP